ncbi:SRPBCC domain-containing protein [Gordonia sp. NPDC003504]
MMSTSTRYPEAVIEADAEVPIIHITRDFHGTPAQLMRAHTDPELFVRWVGPSSISSRIIDWDVRDGGSWRYISERDGEQFGFRGCFHTVSDDTIVQTFTFEGMPDQVALETLWFEDLGDGMTRLHAQSLCDSFAARDGWLASGMEVGVNEGYAALQSLIESGQM